MPHDVFGGWMKCRISGRIIISSRSWTVYDRWCTSRARVTAMKREDAGSEAMKDMMVVTSVVVRRWW